MFSDNYKISGRQAGRLFMLDLFGVNSLMLPGFAARSSGKDGILAILLGFLILGLFLVLMNLVKKRMKTDYYSLTISAVGKLGADLIAVIYWIQLLLCGSFILRMLGEIVKKTLVQDSSMWIIVAVMLLVSVYCAGIGMEGRARAAEILFLMIGIPFLCMLLFACKKVRLEDLSPIAVQAPSVIIKGGFGVFALSGTVLAFLPFMVSFGIKRKEMMKAVGKAVLYSGVLQVVLFCILLGTFGLNGIKAQTWPVVTLMTVVKIPGGFLERFDAIMAGVWIISSFFLISGSIFYSSDIMKRVTGIKKNKGVLTISVLILFALSMSVYTFEMAERLIKTYLFYFAIPSAVIIPILIVMIDIIKEKNTRTVKKGESK